MGRVFLKKLYAVFTSRRTTVYLIALLFVLYFLGLFIPQKSILPALQYAAWKAQWPGLVAALETLKLTAIHSSPLHAVLMALFFLNLLLVTAGRVPLVLRSVRLPDSVQVTDGTVMHMPVHEKIFMEDEAAIDLLRSRLQRLGFRVTGGQNCFKAVRNRYSPVGSLFFHISFLFFLAGGLFLFHSRFRGETFVTEGQLFSGTRADYRTVTRLSEMRKSLPELRFTVDRIRPRFEKAEPVSLETHITAESGSVGKSGRLDVNHPLRLGTTSILVTDVGIAPFVQIRDQAGSELLGAFVALNIYRGETDHFPVPGTGYDIEVRFWPDAAVDAAGNHYTRSYDIKNPLYAITVRKDGRVISAGSVASPSESILFEGRRLSVTGMRYFGRFMIVDEQGGGLLITGFVLALIGLAVTFIWPKKELLGAWSVLEGKPVLYLGYHVEYQKGLGRQEFERLLSEVIKI